MDNFQTEISKLQKDVQILPANLNIEPLLTQNQPITNSTIQSHIPKIVTDIAKMNNVFINTIKLNEKVHSSIVQLETNINTQANNFMNSTLMFQKKFEQTLKQTKSLYEETIHQNQKARFLLQQFINPIREELKSKVDQTTFSLQMKMILDEYDQMGHKITYDNEEELKVKQQKKKTINSETLLFLKNQILPLISNIEHQVLLNKDELEKHAQSIEELKGKSNYFDSEIQKYFNQLSIIQNKFLRQLNNKTSDSLLQKKFKEYSNRFIQESFESSIKNIRTMQRQIKNMGTQIKVSMQFMKNTNESIVQNNKRIQKQLHNYGNNLKNVNQKIDDKISSIDNIFSLIKKEEFNKELSMVQKKVSQIQKKMGNVNQISQSLRQSLLKDIGSNLIGKVNNIQKENKFLIQSIRGVQSKVQSQSGQISCIRDILSKKANFSDILLHIQNKVDKQEFKNFKNNLIDKSDSGQLKSKQIILRQTDVTEKMSRKNSFFNKRSFFSPSPIQKQIQENEQTKRFKLGYTSQFKDKKYWKTYNLRTNLNRTSIFSNQVKE